ncbi:MAG: hypothetical protein LKM30_05920 [Bacilli bacterium]|jgi:hypothetical protein|nr:hypothetical protein [Bacilli bacterium]
MKKKIAVLSFLLALVAGGLTGCNKPTSAASTAGSTAVSVVSTASDVAGSTSTAAEKASLTGAYLSPAKLTYTNMRPTYNYYMTSYTMEELETFSDNTYVLAISYTMFSGLVLPESGNEASGNERTNYVQRFMGTCTSKTNDLDEDTLDVTLAIPNRVIVLQDSTYLADTASWTDDMTTATAVKDQSGNVTTSYANGGEYLASVAFKEQVLSVSKTKASFDYTVFRAAEDTNPSVTATTEKGTFDNAFLSPAILTYTNMRPTYNYYMTVMDQQAITLNNDGTYEICLYSSDFSGLVLPEAGNEASGNERENFVKHFYGTYTSKTNDLDEDSLDITFAAATRAVVTYDSTYLADTANWTDAMTTATAVKDQAGNVTASYATGNDYLTSLKFTAQTVTANKKTHGFDHTDFIGK